jgi:hypothetical protein
MHVSLIKTCTFASLLLKENACFWHFTKNISPRWHITVEATCFLVRLNIILASIYTLFGDRHKHLKKFFKVIRYCQFPKRAVVHTPTSLFVQGNSMGWIVGRAPSWPPFNFYSTIDLLVWLNLLNYELGTWFSTVSRYICKTSTTQSTLLK